MEHINKSLIIKFAFYTAIATTAYFFESMAARALPIPFLRIGLANAIVLYLLIKENFIFAFSVNILKTMIGGLMSFTLLSPATILSLCGGICSILVMWMFINVPIKFSIIGISISGAVVHNITQVFCVRWLIIQRDSVMILLPLLLIIGIITGFITGIIAHELCNRLEGNEECVKSPV